MTSYLTTKIIYPERRKKNTKEHTNHIETRSSSTIKQSNTVKTWGAKHFKSYEFP